MGEGRVIDLINHGTARSKLDFIPFLESIVFPQLEILNIEGEMPGQFITDWVELFAAAVRVRQTATITKRLPGQIHRINSSDRFSESHDVFDETSLMNRKSASFLNRDDVSSLRAEFEQKFISKNGSQDVAHSESTRYQGNAKSENARRHVIFTTTDLQWLQLNEETLKTPDETNLQQACNSIDSLYQFCRRSDW